MARFDGDNVAYAAALILWMRQQPEGGKVGSPCEPKWASGKPVCQSDLLVLVHGFNNNAREAQDAYLAFRGRQKSLVDPGCSERIEAMLGDAFWPGDANWASALDTVDFLVYPATIERALETASALAAYLRTRSDVLNLNFVGHSMGCRVVLETIRLLREDPEFRTPIRKVCLMAAAVPTSMVLPGGQLEKALIAADDVRVLYSPDDTVLAYAFPVGQTAGGEGFFPEAVGHNGDVPLSPGHVGRDQVVDAAHSDYWGWRDNAPSDLAAQLVCDFLAVVGGGRSIGGTRSQGSRFPPRERDVALPRLLIGGR